MNKPLVKRISIWLVNSLLVLIIIGIIIATWMPAIYTSPWFKQHFPKLAS